MVNLPYFKIFNAIKFSPSADSSILDDYNQYIDIGIAGLYIAGPKDKMDNIKGTMGKLFSDAINETAKYYRILYILALLNAFPEYTSLLGKDWDSILYYDAFNKNIDIKGSMEFEKFKSTFDEINLTQSFRDILNSVGLMHDYLNAETFEEKIVIFSVAVGLYTDWI